MKKILYKWWSIFLNCFGNIKIFNWPMWIVYDPDDYQVTGNQVLDITDMIQDGDIILRGYNRYLDGKFIPNFKNDKIGNGFSHGAIYIGKNKVIHAIAKGVSTINLIDFLQCDRIAIFRPSKNQKSAIKKAKSFVKNNIPYDFSFKLGSSALYCFELCVECYSKLNIKPKNISKLFGIINKKNVYVAQSFIESPDLKLIYCWNPKSNISFKL